MHISPSAQTAALLLYSSLLWPNPPQSSGTSAAPPGIQQPTRIKPALLLAEHYEEGVNLREYLVSEKLDGIRAYWDGSHLITRGGTLLHPPAWFTRGFPATALDGELWLGHGQFERLAGIVMRDEAVDADWRQVRYMVFDLPASPAPFTQRLQRLLSLVASTASPALAVVGHFRVADHDALMRHLQRVTDQGGEGLMLHRVHSLYQGRRSDDLLKVKHHQDAEARVVGHIPGNGKYAGMLGSLLVELPDGKRFRLGTGFSDAERRDPPALGSLVTFRYRGTTARGIPRFASFLRVREAF